MTREERAARLYHVYVEAKHGEDGSAMFPFGDLDTPEADAWRAVADVAFVVDHSAAPCRHADERLIKYAPAPSGHRWQCQGCGRTRPTEEPSS